MFRLLRQCLDLRDKYMAVSNQRLGDNPRDHDSVFHGIPEGISDVMGVRPEAASAYMPAEEQFEPWHIYPSPPAPQWQWTADKEAVLSETAPRRDIFDFSQIEVPGAHDWGFEVDDKGVYQVYHDVTGRAILSRFANFFESSISKR
jgi:AMP deaminase